MKIKWLGVASFLITTEKGVRIIVDPYKSGGPIKSEEYHGPADIVTISHAHNDHNYLVNIEGNPQIIKESKPVEAKGIKFNGIAAFHDEVQGKKRGPNICFYFDVDGLRVLHLGDLGHMLSDEQMAQVGKVDILLTPVGGLWAIDAATAWNIAQKLPARVVIPMHFRDERCDFPVAGVDEFLKGKKNVQMVNSSEIEFKVGKLPAEMQIIVLKPAL
jgi:L-ascorbate metabolism protein UlaG (beta-lactamase superfamily)